jgi:hypothetical protein
LDKSYISLLNDFKGTYGKEIFDKPDQFRTLFLDFSKNEYKAEVLVFCQFLSSTQIKEINYALELHSIAKRFKQTYLFDKKVCEITVFAYAYLKSFISKETFNAEISEKNTNTNETETSSPVDIVQKSSAFAAIKITENKKNDIITLVNHGWTNDKIAATLKIPLDEVNKIFSTKPASPRLASQAQYNQSTNNNFNNPGINQNVKLIKKNNSSSSFWVFFWIIIAIIIIIYSSHLIAKPFSCLKRKGLH